MDSHRFIYTVLISIQQLIVSEYEGVQIARKAKVGLMNDANSIKFNMKTE